VIAPAAATARPAPRLIDKHGRQIHGKPARWLQQSRMPMVGGRVRLIVGGCPHRPAFAGCVYARRPRWLYLNEGAYNPKSVVYHELGHTFDFELLRRSDRKKFKRVMHLKRPGWFAGKGPPSELFAEAYALCSRFGMRRPPASKLGWTHSRLPLPAVEARAQGQLHDHQERGRSQAPEGKAEAAAAQEPAARVRGGPAAAQQAQPARRRRAPARPAEPASAALHAWHLAAWGRA